MKFSLNRSLEILERTPGTLFVLLADASPEWTMADEGEGTWNAFDVVGHLIHGEQTDWMARIEIIRSDKADKTFKPFDRFAQLKKNKDKSITDLLLEFKALRKKNLQQLRKLSIRESELRKTGIHPALGVVSLSELISTWVVHDLDHLAQVSRILAKQYKDEVGPFYEYLRILK